jgi:vacuolar-type H+-ATPase subunit F/Vma7
MASYRITNASFAGISLTGARDIRIIEDRDLDITAAAEALASATVGEVLVSEKPARAWSPPGGFAHRRGR